MRLANCVVIEFSCDKNPVYPWHVLMQYINYDLQMIFK